jgi:hypothetical protein
MPYSPDRMTLTTLPDDFVPTRESLRALACFVLSPAYKAQTGRIGLRPVAPGFGTRPLDDGSRLVVRGSELAFDPGPARPITTLRAAAEFAGIPLSADPGVGHDLPIYEPDAPLPVGGDASRALGAWYGVGEQTLDALRSQLGADTVTEAQIWPEHFDFAVTATVGDDVKVNVGFSPGDGFHADPYVYVGPHDTGGLTGDYWNAPFGAVLPYARLAATDAPSATALAFVTEGLGLLAG